MKKRYLLNVSVLGLLILLGVFMGIAAMTLNTQSYWSKSANKDNTLPSNIANWTKGGISSNFTFVINMTGFDNVTQINITIPSVFIIPNFNKQAGRKHFGIYNGSTNFTEYQSDKVGVGGWNITINKTDNGIVMFNQSRRNASNLSDNRYRIYFNLTSTSPGTENTVNFSVVLISRDIGKRVVATRDFGVTGGVDDLKPRLVNINISDGTNVLRDSLAKGDPASLNGTGWLNNNSKITITIEILEYNRRESVTYLFWNSSRQARVPTTLTNGWHAKQGTQDNSVRPIGDATTGGGGVINMTRRTTCKNTDTGLQRCIYNATLAAGNFTDKNTTSIVIFMNDTFNHVSIWNNSDIGYNFSIDGTNDNIKPRLININISDGTYVLRDDLAATHPRSLNGSGWIRNASSVTITIEINESTRRGSVAYLFWNSSRMARVPTALTNGWYRGSSAIPNAGVRDGAGGVINMTRRTACRNINLGVRSCIYTATLAANNFTDKNTTSIVIFMNDTFNTVSVWNNSDRGYNFTVDGVEPTTTITMPADTLINAQRSIAIKCVAGDDGSGANLPSITITGPAGDTVTKTVDVSTNEATFSASEVGRAGDYDVKCETVDNVGKSGSSSITDAFRVTATTAGVSGGGGGGGGGEEAVKVFDVDLSKEDSKIIKRSKGTSVTLTFDGATEHKINWDDVTATSAKFTISSNPITLTLNKGDIKKVDINNDGIDDMSVKLREIDGDQAEILVAKLEGAAVVVEEETKIREEAEEKARAEEIKEKEAASKKTLWITIIVVIVIVIAIVIILKSRGKGKRGSVKFTRKDLGY